MVSVSDIPRNDYAAIKTKNVIEKAIQPFPVRSLTVFRYEDMFEGIKFRVEIEPLSKYPFEVILPHRYVGFHAYEIAAIVSRRAADHYAGVHIPPEDHIILGED